MDNTQSLCHTKWDCKYHVVWIPKYRRKVLYGQIRKYLGELLHVLLEIPPKYSVSQVIGFIKGKSAINIARTYLGQRKNFTGMHFWARGYFVTTVGADEETVRAYIQKQETEDKRLEQLSLLNNG